jgi:hypothetical protein
MMRQSRLHRVFGADDLQASGGDLVVMQPTSADPWYDSTWRYVRPYQLLLYCTVMKPGEVMEAREGEVVKVSTIKSVPEMDGGKPWYPVTLDDKARAVQLKTENFPYWPAMSRPPGTFVKVLPKQFRVLATEMQGTALGEDAQRTYQAMLDALTSILTPRIGTIVTAATKAKPLDEDENDRARAAVARTLAKAIFSLWFERLFASRSEPNLDTFAEKGIMLFSDDNTASSSTKQDGAWDTLGQLRAFADSLTTEAGLPDFDKPDADGGNGFARALAKIAREPSSPDMLTGGTTPGDLLAALAKTGTVALDPSLFASAAQRAAMLWTVKRSAPVAPSPAAPASAATPATSAAPSIVPAAAAAQRESETTARTPQRGGMGAKDAGAPSWLLPVAAGVVGLAIVSALVRRD